LDSRLGGAGFSIFRWPSTSGAAFKLFGVNEDEVIVQQLSGTTTIIHIDSTSSAFLYVDRHAANRSSFIRHQTAGVDTWWVGLTDSDIAGFSGSEYIIGTTFTVPELYLDTGGLFVLQGATPYISLLNLTHEDSDGGRETRLNFKGQQSGGEVTTLARIEIGHDGSADDEKGYLDVFINDGDDGDSPTHIMRVDSNSLGIKSNKELRFFDNGNYVGFEAPALTSDQIWVLPAADGNADEVIKTDGSGALSFVRMTKAIYAELSDSADQTFAQIATAYSITFDTNDEIVGITHSTSSNTENIIIVTTGVYTIFAQPQVAAAPGGAGVFHMWLQKDTGGGFADIANTNIELSLASSEEDVIPLATTFLLSAGDIIRLRTSVSDTDIKLDAQTPANEPAIPSIIFTMFMVGT